MERWSTWRNLFGLLVPRSMTKLRPRLFSTWTMWHVILQFCPVISSLDNWLNLAWFVNVLLSALASSSAACSSVAYLRKLTVKTWSWTDWSSSAMAVMFMLTSFLKWSPLYMPSRMSFET